jgi:putative exosortase-associated protein (TIGR04073 family)
MKERLYMSKLSATILPFLGLAFFVSGCAGPEQKLGRGFNNLTEITRMGEIRRSIEQSTVLENRDQAFSKGLFHGIDMTAMRTAVGLYEVATFPIPNHSPKNYDPLFPYTLSENPVYPDSYTPNSLSDQMTAPDTSLGFSGGDIAPYIPGSRFHIFDQ